MTDTIVALTWLAFTAAMGASLIIIAHKMTKAVLG
jgi:hypothetical protein